MLLRDILIEMSREDAFRLKDALTVMFRDLKLKVWMTAHFLDDRATGKEGGQITAQQVYRALNKAKLKFHDRFVEAFMTKNVFEVLLKDHATDLNIVFEINYKKNELRLITVRKKHYFGNDNFTSQTWEVD